MPQHYNPRMEEEKKRREEKIAASRASANPIQQRAPMQAPGMGPAQKSPLAQAGLGIGKQLLGSALGPLGGVLGGLFNVGGKVDYDKKRRELQAQQQTAKAGEIGTTYAPGQRVLFNEAGKQIGQVQGDVIKGYANRGNQAANVGAPTQVDPFEGIAAQIQAQKAAGKPVDYNALAALQHARSTGNEQEKMKKMREFLKKYPQFSKPGGSQGVVKRVSRNVGGPISMKYPGYNVGGTVMPTGYNVGGTAGPLNPNGYREGGPVAPTPIKRVMDEDKIEIQRATFERAEARKDEKFKLDEKRAAEKHAMDMKMKKAAAVTKKAPLAKK